MRHSLPNSVQKPIILGLTLVAFLLRAYRLDFQSYWIDEIWTIYFINLSPGEVLSLLRTVEPHPPLYYPSNSLWLQWVGDSEYAIRFYSLVFGVLAIPLTYRLGKDLGDGRLGLVVAVLMTGAPYQIWHSQEARMYSLLTASSVMSMWGFINMWRCGGRGWWLVYVFGTTWAILSHYYGLILIGIQGLFLLLTWRHHRRYYLAWAGTLVVTFMLILPWLILSWDSLQTRGHWTEQPTLWDTYVRGAIAYSVGEVVPYPHAILLTLAFVATYGLGLVYATRRRWGLWSGQVMFAFLSAYTIAPNIAVWLYGELRSPAYFERYLIPVQVGYLLTVAIGILAIADGLPAVMHWVKHRRREAKLNGNRAGKQRDFPFPRDLTWLHFGSRWVTSGLAICLLICLVIINGWVLNHHYADPVYAKPNWRGLIRTIENLSMPGDAILLTGDGGEKLFDYYYRGDLPVFHDFNTPVPAPDEARRLIADITAAHRRLWFTPYGAGIDATLESWLARNTYPAWHSWLGRKRLALYDTQAITKRQEILNFSFVDSTGQGLELTSAILPKEATAAGDLLPLNLTWQTYGPLQRDYQLSLRLINNREDTFVQSDWPPLAAREGTSTWPSNQPVNDRRSLWIPPDVPPSDYLLQLVVYDPSSGESLGQPAIIPGIAIKAAEMVAPLEALSIPNLIEKREARIEKQDLTLVGYALPQEIQPGQEMWLWLYWQAHSSLAPDTTLRLGLDSEGEMITTDYLLADSVGPLDSWQPGQVRRAIYYLPTSPRLMGETAEVKVALVSGQKVEAETSVAPVKLIARPRQFEVPTITRPTDIDFGHAALIKLLGYDLPATHFIAGDGIPITLYWQAEAETKIDYAVFIHLLDETDQVVAQVDSQPQGGAAPPTTWLPGEILTDPYTLLLPADLPPGNYRLIAGLYDAATGARLPVASGGEFVELGEVMVK